MTVATESPLLERLKAVLAEIADHAQQILECDARVSMPHAGAEARADVASTVTQIAHGRFVSDEVGRLLADLDAAGHDPDTVEGALIRITRRDWEPREPDPLRAGRRDGEGERRGGGRMGRGESCVGLRVLQPSPRASTRAQASLSSVLSRDGGAVRRAGLFGYFPTYQLGNVISVQIWDRARARLGELEEQFARGEFRPLRKWLSEQIYRQGSRYPPPELLRRVTGSEIDPEPYLKYLDAKFA